MDDVPSTPSTADVVRQGVYTNGTFVPISFVPVSVVRPVRDAQCRLPDAYPVCETRKRPRT